MFKDTQEFLIHNKLIKEFIQSNDLDYYIVQTIFSALLSQIFVIFSSFSYFQNAVHDNKMQSEFR